MRILRDSLVLLGGCLALPACLPNFPLVFGQAHSLGVTINGSPARQSAELTLGYRDLDVAVVPVTAIQPNGATTQLKSTANACPNQQYEDALSVLGQFEVSSKSETPQISLGKFFATGTAAKKLADGFAAELAGSTGQSQPAKPCPPAEKLSHS